MCDGLQGLARVGKRPDLDRRIRQGAGLAQVEVVSPQLADESRLPQGRCTVETVRHARRHASALFAAAHRARQRGGTGTLLTG